MSDSVHIRNARALDSRNKQFTLELDGYRERLEALERQNAQLRSRVEVLDQRIMTWLSSRGVGPTEKG